MSNISGVEDNRVFRANNQKGDLYYYIDAQLNLAEVIPASADQAYTVFYFNKENNLNYLKYSNIDTYPSYIKLEPNVVIGEVVTYVNPDGVVDDNLNFEIGGILKPSVAMNYAEIPANDDIDLWGGPTGNVPGTLYFSSPGNVQDGQICHTNRSPEDIDLKYLGIIVRNDSSSQAFPLNANIHVVIKVYPKFQ